LAMVAWVRSAPVTICSDRAKVAIRMTMATSPQPADCTALMSASAVCVSGPPERCRWTKPLHVPDMGLLVAGDVVYNGVHLYLTESDGIGGIDEWLAALDTAEALRPATVIAGHKDPRASTIHHRSRQHGAISPTRADCLSRRNRPTSSTRRCCVCTLGESTRARYGAQQPLCFP